MQAGYPEAVSSERPKSGAPTVSGEPEGKTAACEPKAPVAIRSQ